MNDGDKKEQTSHNRSILENIHTLPQTESALREPRYMRYEGCVNVVAFLVHCSFSRWLGKPATYMAY